LRRNSDPAKQTEEDNRLELFHRDHYRGALSNQVTYPIRLLQFSEYLDLSLQISSSSALIFALSDLSARGKTGKRGLIATACDSIPAGDTD
jgi:hypothetical protein